MPETSRGLRYPGQSDPVDVAGDIQNLATDVTNMVQSGSVELPFNNEDTASASVAFPVAFASTPHIVVTARNVRINCSTQSPSASGVTIYGRRVDSPATQGSPVTVDWIAVGAVT